MGERRTWTQAFADDTYALGEARQAGLAIQAIEAAYAKLGLTLHPDKFKIWAPGVPEEEIPPSLRRFRVDSLVALGTTIPYAQRGKWLSGCFDADAADVAEAEDGEERADVTQGGVS